LKDGDKGAITAVHHLCSFFKDSLNDPRFRVLPSDSEVIVRIYVNRKGLARALVEAGIIPTLDCLDTFFVKLTHSRSLFDVVDCGGGKERVDDKIRGMSRLGIGYC
jgi:hypothetical protein